MSIELEVDVVNYTGKAILVDVDGREVWIPISCIDLDNTDVEFKRGAFGMLAVEDWFAEKEGLEG